MAVPFGFSVGDFISTLNLVRNIVTALQDSRGAVVEFRGITATLTGLEQSLQQLRGLGVGDSEINSSLRDANGQFQETIDNFVDKVLSYETSLRPGGSGHRFKDAFKKVQWTLTQQGHLEAFQGQILRHGTSIQILLNAAIAKAVGAQSTSITLMRSDIAELRRHVVSIEATLNDTRNVVHTLNSVLSTCASEFRGLLQGLMRLNVALFNLVVSFRSRMPLTKSILFDKPVTFQDAGGRHFPIQLQWINCWEAFEDVLLIQHKGRPGLHAVEYNHYKLQDAAKAGKWSELERDLPFEQAFRAGGSVDMTVIFPYEPESGFTCPKCNWPEGKIVETSRIECPNPDCDLVYSKADYVNNDVIAYPAHFEIPKIPSLDEDSADRPSTSSDEQHDEHGSQNINSDGGEAKNAPENTPFMGGVNAEPDKVADFTNVYITRPALVTVRDSSKVWYNFPWRVMHSFEGARFMIELFTDASVRKYALRDRDFDNDLDGQNWHELAYPGIIVEILDASGSPADPTPAHPASKGRGVPTVCRLCGVTCSTEAALRSHATTHLKRRPCPVDGCTICPQSDL